MANWATLKAAINNVIKTNGNQAITGQALQNTLNNIISSIGENYQFVDIATPITNPGVPDGNVFYIAYTAGAYVNFSNIAVNSNEVVFLLWNGKWNKKTIGLATAESLNSIIETVNGIVKPLKASIGYVVCDANGSTVAKKIASTDFSISTNCRFTVKMVHANTAENPTLSINNTIAKPLYYNGNPATKDNTWHDNEIIDLSYDGNVYQTYSIESSDSGNLILEWDTDAATTRKQVPSYNRKVGLQISYNNGTEWIYEQFIGTTGVTDTPWGQDSNWQRILMEKSVSKTVDVNNVGKLPTSEAILDEFYDRNLKEYISIIPSRVSNGKKLQNSQLVDNAGWKTIYFVMDREVVITANIGDSPDIYATRLLRQDFNYSGGQAIYDFFKPGQNTRVPLSFEKIGYSPTESSYRIIAFSVPIDSEYAIEYNTKYSYTFKHDKVFSIEGNVPVVKVIPNKSYNGLAQISNDNTDIVILPFDISIDSLILTYQLADNTEDYVFLNSFFKGIKVVSKGSIYSNQQVVKRNIKTSLTKDSDNYTQIKYVSFAIKKGSTLKAEGKTTVLDVYGKNHNFWFEQMLPSWIGDTLNGKKIKTTGEIQESQGGIVYLVNPLALKNMKILTSAGTVYLYDFNKQFIKKKSIPNAYVDTTEFECGYIGFNDATFSIKGERIEETIPNWKEYNILDYLGSNYSSSFVSALQELVNNVSDNGGGIIYVPAGIYYYRLPVQWKSNVWLKGAGENLTIFVGYGNQAFITGDNVENVHFQDFTIDGQYQTKISTVNADTKGLFLKAIKGGYFKNITIKNTAATGFGCDFFGWGVIEKITCINCGRLADLAGGNAGGCSGIGIGTGVLNGKFEPLVINNCYCKGCGQYGIFLEDQFTEEYPYGTIINNCVCTENRTGFGCSGTDGAIFSNCVAYNNHHAGFAFDAGTMAGSSKGRNVKYNMCIAADNGRNMPKDYPVYRGEENGFGWYIMGDREGVEMIGCSSINNLKSGIGITGLITNLFISGGEIKENGEHGISIKGAERFKISPNLIKDNIGDGIKIDGNMRYGYIRDIIITGNNNAISKTDSYLLKSVTIDGNFVYENTNDELPS